jgi:hypothetical protein
LYAAFKRADEPQKPLDEGAFPGAVFAHDAKISAPAYREGKAADNGMTAITKGNIVTAYNVTIFHCFYILFYNQEPRLVVRRYGRSSSVSSV